MVSKGGVQGPVLPQAVQHVDHRDNYTMSIANTIKVNYNIETGVIIFPQ